MNRDVRAAETAARVLGVLEHGPKNAPQLTALLFPDDQGDGRRPTWRIFEAVNYLRANGVDMAAIGGSVGGFYVVGSAHTPIVPPASGKPWTPAEDEMLRSGYSDDTALAEIAESLGRGVIAVSTRASFLRITRRSREKLLPPDVWQQFLKLRGHRISLRGCGRVLGIGKRRLRSAERRRLESQVSA